MNSRTMNHKSFTCVRCRGGCLGNFDVRCDDLMCALLLNCVLCDRFYDLCDLGNVLLLSQAKMRKSSCRWVDGALYGSVIPVLSATVFVPVFMRSKKKQINLCDLRRPRYLVPGTYSLYSYLASDSRLHN